MKTARIALLAILVAGLSVAGDAGDEVSNAEKAVAAARAANDAAALDRLTADDFIWVRPTGAVTSKKELLEDLTAGRLAKYDFDGEQRIRIFGDSAVVTGARVLHVGAVDRKIMVTNVWVRKEGSGSASLRRQPFCHRPIRSNPAMERSICQPDGR